MYADFDFYKDVFMGNTITQESEFKRLERKAAAFVDEMTLKRIKEPNDSIKMAVCEVAEIEQREQKENNEDQIVSETVGPHSVSYAKKNKSVADYRKEKAAAVRLYLANTGLLYRGISCSS